MVSLNVLFKVDSDLFKLVSIDVTNKAAVVSVFSNPIGFAPHFTEGVYDDPADHCSHYQVYCYEIRNIEHYAF